VQVAVNYTELS